LFRRLFFSQIPFSVHADGHLTSSPRSSSSQQLPYHHTCHSQPLRQQTMTCLDLEVWWILLPGQCSSSHLFSWTRGFWIPCIISIIAWTLLFFSLLSNLHSLLPLCRPCLIQGIFSFQELSSSTGHYNKRSIVLKTTKCTIFIWGRIGSWLNCIQFFPNLSFALETLFPLHIVS
jgi:hypothetical protein